MLSRILKCCFLKYQTLNSNNYLWRNVTRLWNIECCNFSLVILAIKMTNDQSVIIWGKFCKNPKDENYYKLELWIIIFLDITSILCISHSKSLYVGIVCCLYCIYSKQINKKMIPTSKLIWINFCKNFKKMISFMNVLSHLFITSKKFWACSLRTSFSMNNKNWLITVKKKSDDDIL